MEENYYFKRDDVDDLRFCIDHAVVSGRLQNKYACLASRLRLLQRSQVGYTTVSIAFVTFVAPCQLRRTHCLRTIFH